MKQSKKAIRQTKVVLPSSLSHLLLSWWKIDVIMGASTFSFGVII